jgi:hypothetical protein
MMVYLLTYLFLGLLTAILDRYTITRQPTALVLWLLTIVLWPVVLATYGFGWLEETEL